MKTRNQKKRVHKLQARKKQASKYTIGVAGAHMAWEDADQVSFVVPQYPHRQAWARAA
jgi:hypothetical protein